MTIQEKAGHTKTVAFLPNTTLAKRTKKSSLCTCSKLHAHTRVGMVPESEFVGILKSFLFHPNVGHLES